MESKMQCKPDLIVRNGNRNVLFEFKATSELLIPFLESFDSVFAQVWCYSKLEEIIIDEFNLFKYYINPLNSPFNSLTVLSDNELDNSKFEPLFENYIKLINLLNEVSNNSNPRRNEKKLLHKLNLRILNLPKNDEIRVKCSNCSLRKSRVCIMHNG